MWKKCALISRPHYDKFPWPTTTANGFNSLTRGCGWSKWPAKKKSPWLIRGFRIGSASFWKARWNRQEHEHNSAFQKWMEFTIHCKCTVIGEGAMLSKVCVKQLLEYPACVNNICLFRITIHSWRNSQSTAELTVDSPHKWRNSQLTAGFGHLYSTEVQHQLVLTSVLVQHLFHRCRGDYRTFDYTQNQQWG